MKRWFGRLAAVVLTLTPLLVAAVDAPHDQTFTDGNCDNCHSLYQSAPSGTLDYSSGCMACHNTIANSTVGYPWLTSDQSRPGSHGNQHSWTGYVANPRYGTRTPTNAGVAQRLVDGKLQCAVCHDNHNANITYAPTSKHTSIPTGTAVDETGGPGTGTGKMTLVSTGDVAKAFRVRVAAAGPTGGTIVVSHDFGLATPTWFNWDGAAWVAGTATGPGRPFTWDVDVALDDPAFVVRFSAGAVADDYWDFYVGFPFLRASNVADAFCYQCHFERVMTSLRARGEDTAARPNGIRMFSHPVNEALNANGKNHDRAPETMLDANGVAQVTGDGHSSNNLRLDGGLVRCTTCHAPHGADSNSLTDDAVR